MNKEVEINLLDMFKKLVRYWKLILICTILVGILFPTLRYMSNRIKYNSEVAKAETAKEETTKEEIDLPKLTPQEQSAVEDAWILSSMIEQDQTYMRESLLMQISPFEVPVSSQVYYLSSEGDVESLRAWLTNYVNNGDYYEAIQDQLPISMERQYFQELVCANSPTEKTAISLNAENYPDANGTLISIYAMGDSEETAEQIAILVGAALESFDTANADVIAPHTLTFLNANTGTWVRPDLQQMQDLVKSRIVNNSAALQGKINAFTEDQKAVYSGMLNLETEESDEANLIDNNTDKVIVPPTISKRDCMVGILLGLVIGIILAALSYIFGGKLHTAEDVRKSIGIPVLTDLGAKKNWESRKELLMTNLLLACRKAEVNSIVIGTTGHFTSDDNLLINEMKEQLSKEEIEIDISERLLENPRGISELSKYGNLIMMECIEKSKLRDICAIRRFCSEIDVMILGLILTDQ